MRKIAIIGPGGAGKSTVARALGEILGIGVIHLDRLFWRPGWVETPPEEWACIQRGLVAGDAWILDGNYGGSLDIRLVAADTVIFLDTPRATCVLRVFRRAVRFRGRSRPDLAPGCRERITGEFVRWVWTYPAERRPAILAKLAAYADGRRIVVLRGRRDVRRFLDELRREVA